MTILKTLYRAAINLAPSEYRAAYGDEQWRLFELVIANERPHARLARIVWAIDLLARACWAAVQVRLDRRQLLAGSKDPAFEGFGSGRGSMGSDLRFTLRSVRTAPWYATAVIAVTAVTVALATTTFAIVDGVLFRPLPYPDAAALVTVEPAFAAVPPPVYRDRATFLGYSASEVDLANWQASVPEVPITAFRAQQWSGLGASRDEAAGLALVQPNFFDVIGVAPLIGGLTPDDYRATPKMKPVIISYDAWMARFDGDRRALGQEIITDLAGGGGVRIVGIMPKGFTFPAVRTDVTFISPFVSDPKTRENPAVRQLSEVIARLPPGMTAASFEDRLMRGVATTAAVFPPQGPKPPAWSDNGWRREGPYDDVNVASLTKALGRQTRPLFMAVFAAVVLLVTIAAANVASLMSARALERQAEIQVRRALGAGAWAVGRLWTMEAATLVAIGGACGGLATPLLMGVMLQVVPEGVVFLKPPSLDWRVAGFVVLTLVQMVLLVSIAPMKRSLALAGTQTRGASERVRTPGRLMVIGSQVGVAFVLTVVGACLVGSLMTVYAHEQPVQVDGVVAVDVMLHGGDGLWISPVRAQREQTLRARLLQVPGVIAVGATSAQVLKGGGALPEFEAPAGRKHLVNQDMWGVSEGFYDVVAPQVVEGRLPTRDELRTSAPLIVVSEQVARNFWPGRSPIGQTLTHWQSKAAFTVIGVVRDVRWVAWDLESPIIYSPYASTARYSWLTYFIRTNANTGRVIDDAIKAIEETDGLARPGRANTLDEVFRESVSLRRFQSWLFGGFAAAALVVVGVGIFGLLAMSTARRTREVGIRCALGATPNSVAGLIIREQTTAVIAGLAAGAGVAAWAVGFVKGYLYEITVTDPRIWATATALILFTALIGALVPAWRASRIDPLKALRVE